MKNKTIAGCKLTWLASAATLAILWAPVSARAQSGAAAPADIGRADNSPSASEIIVTARKRSETAISVPVTITAVTGETLRNQALSGLDSVARLVPNLTIGENNSIGGGIVSIRGLAGADTNPFGDQAVSFNLDGVQVAQASVRRMSQMDIEQVEVLKGPQALFFGKNSPAGVISVRTADPTSTWEGRISGGYEFQAREYRGEGYVSGPISDTLGVRLAGYYADMAGWVRNVSTRATTGPGVYPASHSRAPNQSEYAGRFTALWQPSSNFEARLKLNYGHVKGSGVTELTQIVRCPLGLPQANRVVDNCKADDKTATGNIGPNFGAVIDPRFGDGHTFLKSSQFLGGLELNYDVTDYITLTSVTGYYNYKSTSLGNYAYTYVESGIGASTFLPSHQFYKMKQFSQEFRATTSFSGPFNFMLGGYYQKGSGDTAFITSQNALNPVFVNNYAFGQKVEAWSVFGQALIDILPTLEIAAGGRYSHEAKRLPVALSATAATPRTFYEITGPNYRRSLKFHDFSPEVTLTWRPSKTLTIYGGYKEGFMSGGFNANNPLGFSGTNPSTVTRNDFDQQTTAGFEGGIKGAFLDGDLLANFALYNYKTKGLQVTVTVGGTQVELRNAGSVRTKGAEFDFSYRTPVEGLKLFGAVGYSKGRYIDYQAPCYRGEPTSLCFVQINRVTGNPALLQDLSGTPLVRAPEWTGNAGFSFERPMSRGLKFGLSADMSFSSGHFTSSISSPQGYQKAYQLFNASARLMDVDDRWEIALIGRNLGNKFYWVRNGEVAGTAGGSTNSPILGDIVAAVSRGREIMVRLSYQFGR